MDLPVLSIPSLGVRLSARPGTPLLGILRSVPELALETPCGGTGRCGKCRIRILSGSLGEAAGAELQRLTSEELRSGIRLACLAHIEESIEIDIPGREQTRIAVMSAFSPELLSAGQNDGNDFDPLMSRIELPRASGRRSGPPCGLAVDVGTTTLALYLVDLENGKTLAARGVANPQSFAGADVISRISYSAMVAGGLAELKDSLLSAVETAALEMAGESSIDPARILVCTVAGNSVMLHILLGVDPAPLARTPFTPVFLDETALPQGALPRLPSCGVILLPGLGAYVGADAAAGFTALNRDPADGPFLYLDIGTNGEILLAKDTVVYACAAAAGPAFEGASLSSGSGGIPGAVASVDLVDGRLQTVTVDDANPVSICGSGVIDLIRILLEYRLIDDRGKLVPTEELPVKTPAELIERRVVTGKMAAFVYSPLTSDSPPLLLTQQDVRQIQLAKAAIATGIELLRDAADCPGPAALDLYLAGGFGFHLRPESAIAIGLLPDISPERVHPLGNAAGFGAIAALKERGFRRRVRALRDRTRLIDLASEASFQQLLMKNINFSGPAATTKRGAENATETRHC